MPRCSPMAGELLEGRQMPLSGTSATQSAVWSNVSAGTYTVVVVCQDGTTAGTQSVIVSTSAVPKVTKTPRISSTSLPSLPSSPSRGVMGGLGGATRDYGTATLGGGALVASGVVATAGTCAAGPSPTGSDHGVRRTGGRPSDSGPLDGRLRSAGRPTPIQRTAPTSPSRCSNSSSACVSHWVQKVPGLIPARSTRCRSRSRERPCRAGSRASGSPRTRPTAFDAGRDGGAGPSRGPRCRRRPRRAAAAARTLPILHAAGRAGQFVAARRQHLELSPSRLGRSDGRARM